MPKILNHKGQAQEPDYGANNPGGRCCANCAVMFRIDPPADAPLGALPVFICRREPPQTKFYTAEGALVDGKTGDKNSQLRKAVVQQETQGHMVCWSWKRPGTLPGNIYPEATDDK
jgi:hypothetical protein